MGLSGKGDGVHHPGNAALARYKHHALATPQRSVGERLLRFAVQLMLVALHKTLAAASVPFGRLFAAYLWCGKSFLSVALFLEHQLLSTVGWLSSNAFLRGHRISRISQHYFAADLKRWHVGVAAVMMASFVHSMFRKIRDQFDERLKRRKYYRRLMTAASSYEQWKELAEQLTDLEELDASKGPGKKKAGGIDAAKHQAVYDRKLLLEKTLHLRRIRTTYNVKEMMFALRVDLLRNVANIAKSHKQVQFVRVPEPIQRYIREVREQLFMLADWPETELMAEEKLSFFRETRHTFGRTALLLSGGGGLGTFHIGVAKALFERHMLPRVLAGSSVGSIVCAITATRTDSELRELFSKLDQFDVYFFQNSRAVELVHHLINKGSLQDMTYMVKKLRALLGDLTFLEAYDRTGRILNITVCPADTNEPPRLLNYLTAPHALVWSAVAASSAFPGLFAPQHLLARNSAGEIVKFSAQSGTDNLERRWRDGSLELDLPVQTLGEMFNCNHFLVSQTNPHIVPLLNLKQCFSHKWGAIMEAELKHRLQVAQWMMPEWVPTKWLTLFTQPWEGDITFTLPSALWNLGKTIVNPSTEELMRSVKVGEVATWEKMSAIECNCTIEATLDKCLAKISNQVRGRSMSRMGGKIPSWLHMPSVGLPAVFSWGDNIGDADMAQTASWGDMDMAAAHAMAAAMRSQQRQHSGGDSPMQRARSSASGAGYGVSPTGAANGTSLVYGEVPGVPIAASAGPPLGGVSEVGDAAATYGPPFSGIPLSAFTRRSMGMGGAGGGPKLTPISSSKSSSVEFDSASSMIGGLGGGGATGAGGVAPVGAPIAAAARAAGATNGYHAAGGGAMPPDPFAAAAAAAGAAVPEGVDAGNEFPGMGEAAGDDDEDGGADADADVSSAIAADVGMLAGGLPLPELYSRTATAFTNGGPSGRLLRQQQQRQQHGFGGLTANGVPAAFGSAGVNGGISTPPSPPTPARQASTASSGITGITSGAGGSGSGGHTTTSLPPSDGASTYYCSDADLIALAQMDCTDASATDLWNQLLPLAGQCITPTERTEAVAAATAGGGAAEGGHAGDAIDVFAY